MTMIFEIPEELVAWLIPYLMANNLAFILVILTTWWSVLVIGLLWMWIYNINIAMLFLTLVSVMTKAWEWLFEDSIANLLSLWTWDLRLSLLHLLNEWKEKWLEKVSIILYSGENSELRGSNKEKTSLKWLSMSIIGPLISWY